MSGLSSALAISRYFANDNCPLPRIAFLKALIIPKDDLFLQMEHNAPHQQLVIKDARLAASTAFTAFKPGISVGITAPVKS